MDILDILAHLGAFSLPPLALALLLPLAGRVLVRKTGVASFYARDVATVFVAGWLALAACALLFGQDGTVAGYAALAVAAGGTQWVLLRGWR